MAHQNDKITERLENEYYPDNEIKHLRQENAHLKSEISKLSTQLRDSQNELHNFRERMGKVVDLKLRSSGVLSEDLTTPCRESELKRMYEKLSKNQWAKLLRQLKTGGPEMTTEKIKEERKKAEAVIKDVLRESQDDIQNIIGTMLCLTPSSQDHTSNSKTTQYFDMAVQNLQIAIFKEKKELYSRAKLQGVPEVLLPMIDDCYKTGCLMALHNPPLLLDWDSCGQAPFPPIKMGKFLPVTKRDTDANTPRKLKSVPVKDRDEDEVPRKPGALIPHRKLETGSATQPGVWIPKRNQEKGNVLPVTERDKNADTPRKVKSVPVKERDEDEVPRVQPEAKTPLPAARSSKPGAPIPHRKLETVKSVPVTERDNDTDILQKGSATQPGVWIPKRNQEKDFAATAGEGTVRTHTHRYSVPVHLGVVQVKPGPQRERVQSVNTFKMGPYLSQCPPRPSAGSV